MENINVKNSTAIFVLNGNKWRLCKYMTFTYGFGYTATEDAGIAVFAQIEERDDAFVTKLPREMTENFHYYSFGTQLEAMEFALRRNHPDDKDSNYRHLSIDNQADYVKLTKEDIELITKGLLKNKTLCEDF